MKETINLRRTAGKSRKAGCTFVFSLTLCSLAISLSGPSVYARSASQICDQPVFHTWKTQQSKRLWAPDVETLERERKGAVFVYNCFTDDEIDRFLQIHDDRMENSHFYPILEIDPVTGEVLDSDDDC